MTSTNPKVSVVLATYGREEVLCETIRQVLSEPYANKELVVIDQTPEHTPETQNYLESVRSEIRYIPMDHPNLTEAENLGIRTASGDILLFVDDDVVFEPGLIDAHLGNYVDETVTGVAGLVLERGRMPLQRMPGVCRSMRFGFFFFRHDYARRVVVPNVPEGNMSFRRQALLDVGLIDERFRENAYLWGMDLAVRVAKQGGRIVHDPTAWLRHLRHASGGIRMKAVRPVSYFRNLFYFLKKHATRHETLSVALRVYFYRVLVEGWRRPWVIPVNTRTFAKAWWIEQHPDGGETT